MFLGVVLIYIFSMANLTFFSPNFENGECNTLRYCLVSLLHEGLRAGGGQGDIYVAGMEGVTFANRPGWKAMNIVINLAFFMIITIVLLNIIFGIIIDTFSALREENVAKKEDIESCCFVCSLSREDIERTQEDYAVHTNVTHSIWNYLFFYIYLQEKDPTEYNGSDRYVNEKIAAGNVDWFPRVVDLERDKETSLPPFVLAKLDKIDKLEATVNALKNALSNAKKIN
eukprot:CAMPEP_0175126668 /NCGR_PEP_ID=MMETSP0087-20121206/3982_1 /TAXON_ID=136419 /ORGANISM="Unknown Unknown, Strain D1" /LENGTH=227 /DNA_ID=CAMNT_0016408607 /DNA_START=447 /DNA_END=1133 /DNA_ORIENTATION=-